MHTVLILRSASIQALVVSGLLVSAPTAHASPASPGSVTASFVSQVDRFAGHYLLVGDQSGDLNTAINQATDTMNFARRSIARRQLRKRALLYPSLVMNRQGDTLKTNLADQTTFALPLSGVPVLWKAPFGEMVQAYLQTGTELREVFETKKGHCENLLRLSPDRNLLTVEVKITSQDLPKPVEYHLVYRRA